MKIKPSKSWSLLIRKGLRNNNIVFVTGGEEIPWLAEQPIRSLGRQYTSELSDRQMGRLAQKQLADGMAKIDRSQLPGKHKAEERVRELLESRDQLIRNAKVDVCTGRRWRAQAEVDEAISMLQHKDVLGRVQDSQAGLGWGEHVQFWSKPTREQRKTMVVEEVTWVEWWHNQVLRKMAELLEKCRVGAINSSGHNQLLIPFVKPGEHRQKPAVEKTSPLTPGKAWEMCVDLGAQETLRPDVVMRSTAAKKALIIELTIPWEEGIPEAYELDQWTLDAGAFSRERETEGKREQSGDDDGRLELGAKLRLISSDETEKNGDPTLPLQWRTEGSTEGAREDVGHEVTSQDRMEENGTLALPDTELWAGPEPERTLGVLLVCKQVSHWSSELLPDLCDYVQGEAPLPLEWTPSGYPVRPRVKGSQNVAGLRGAVMAICPGQDRYHHPVQSWGSDTLLSDEVGHHCGVVSDLTMT
eukprot:superscaffoldBa00000377_g4226